MKLLNITFIVVGIVLADSWSDWLADGVQEHLENLACSWYGRFSSRINSI